MGKGYNNYMCKKPFHPGSKANIKRAWMAEQKTENEKKKQEELKVQYEKEQNLYNNRALLSTESKDKLELNFMYEAPPGAKRERQKEDDEPEYKFEWQRKYNAPREDYAKGNADIKDQPFGIPVRNVRCIKCHKWGHINTDKECPLFSQASTSSMPTTSMDPMELMRQMREDGFGLKENVLGHHLNPKEANQQLIPSDESDPEMEFLKSLSTSEKKKLLKKLKKLSKKQEKSAHCKKKKSKKTRKHKSKHASDSDLHSKSETSGSESMDEKDNSNVISDRHQKKNFKQEEIKSKSSCDISERSRVKDESKKSDSNHQKHSKYTESSEKKEERKEENKKHSTEHSSDKHSERSNKAHKSHDDETVQIKKKKLKSSSSSSEDESSKTKKEKYSKKKEDSTENIKRKYEKTSNPESSKQMKKDPLDSETNSIQSSQGSETSKQHEHPDGFSHLCPQAVINANYEKTKEEYQGDVHDQFRHENRDRRSPSIKQKYNQ